MVKLANTLDLGSSGVILAGSSPVTRTNKTARFILAVFITVAFVSFFAIINIVLIVTCEGLMFQNDREINKTVFLCPSKILMQFQLSNLNILTKLS